MRRTTSLEVYQDSNTLCRLTATVVFLSRGNRIPIKISRYSSFRMAVSGGYAYSERVTPGKASLLTARTLGGCGNFLLRVGIWLIESVVLGYWTAQHISTAMCKTRNDDRGAREKTWLWLVSACIWVPPSDATALLAFWVVGDLWWVS